MNTILSTPSTSLSFATRTRRLLGLVPLMGLALAWSAAGQTFHAQAQDKSYPGEVLTGSSPVTVDWYGANPSTYMYGRAAAAPGFNACFAISEHYTTGSFQSDTVVTATFEFDDVVFTSPGTQAIPVLMNLTIEGDHNLNTGASVEAKVQVQGGWAGTATAKPTGIQTTGALAGYDMATPLSFQAPLNVSVNTPFTIKVGLTVYANTNYVHHKTRGDFRLRLGGTLPTSVGGGVPVFSLPAGVTVDSVQAGIQNNLWLPPTDLYLSATDTNLAVGDDVTLTTFNGLPTKPVGLFVTSVDAAPVLVFLTSSTLAADGFWKFGTIPHVPSLTGHGFGVTSYSVDAQGGLIGSDEVTVSMQ